jgi:acyl carrier protein
MPNQEHLRWLAGLFDEPAENIGQGTRRDEIFGWDSLGMLTLMAELDEKFGIQLSDQDILNLQSVNDVLVLIAAKSAANSD